MAAPMSFYPRVIIGATTFTVVVAGAFYLLYRNRHIFRRRRSVELSTDITVNVYQDHSNTDETQHRKINSRALSNPQSGKDPLIDGLIKLLESEDEGQLCKVLTTLANKAAFTEGQNAVRSAGGLPVIMKHLESSSDRVKSRTASCIANLSLNNYNQPLLKTCIPTLLNLSTDPGHTHGLRLASIQALVNLSVSGQCEEYFSRPAALESLFTLLGDGTSALGQQALRVLVNLSADEMMTPTLLGYEVPENFMHLLESHHPDESLLRTLSFLINLRRGSYSLTTSPKTVSQTSGKSFLNLFTENSGELRVAVKTLMHHGKADVKQQAGRLLVMMSAP